MKKSVEIIGQPIISITEGKKFGHVKELLINNTNGTVAALVIDDGKWYQGAKLVPFNAIAGLGEYAITINNSQDILPVANHPEFESFFEADVKIIGTKVLTKGGKFEGKINDFTIDNTGKINRCELEKNNGEVVEIAAENIVTYGKEVLIISEVVEVTKVTPIEDKNIDTPVNNPEVPATPSTKGSQPQEQEPVDDLARKFDDKHRKFLLGKRASRRIETDNGVVIVEQGGEITEEVLQKAKLAGKFVELSMNIQ